MHHLCLLTNTSEYSCLNAESLVEEAQLQVALEAVICAGLDSKGRPLISLRSAAKRFDVSRSKLTARWNAEAHEARQRMSAAQEEVLKDWIKSLACRSIPLSSAAVAEYASTILGEPSPCTGCANFEVGMVT